MYAEDVMDGGGGGGGWGDFSDFSMAGAGWGDAGWADVTDFSNGAETDWSNAGSATDTADTGVAANNSFASSPTAFSEQTGIDTNSIRDYYQTQFDGLPDSTDLAAGVNSFP